MSAHQRDDQTHDQYVPHDIFLSHSGAQKGFVKDLYKELRRSNFTTFLDVQHHSLPPGENFPKRILQAAKSCRVALVVLSEEFVCSKWPMVELRTFVDAMASASGALRLLPLFFKLCPADLKCKENLKRWRKAWRVHAEQDGKHRIDVCKWEDAVEKLCSQNGILFEQGFEGEQTFIDKVVFAVSEIVPPAFTFDSTFIAGKDRLCQVILDKFESMERHHQSSRVTISSLESACASPTSSQYKVTCVLGLYGLPGSGKSTLCQCLIDHFRPLFGSRNTLYLEFSSTPSNAEVVNKLKGLLHLTNFRDRVDLDGASKLENVESILKGCHLSSCTVFLVVDNISDNTWEAIQRILHLGFGHGSKIILVSHTSKVLCKTLDSLKDGLHWACDSMAIPSIDETEASEILLRTATGCYGAASAKHTFFKSLTSRQMGTVRRLVHMCSCEHGEVWLPVVMKAVGARLLRYETGDLEEWERDLESFWTRVKTYEQSAVIEELLGDNFKALPNEHLQLLFLDVALFILHFEENIDVVSNALSMMHEFSISRLKLMIQDLERHCFLTVSKDGIVSVHDVYLKFAKAIQDGPSKYITTSISWRWQEILSADADQLLRSLLLAEGQSREAKEGKLRALVLEVGDSCERVDLKGFSGLKAVGLRDCKSLAVLGLTGLSSLRILEIRNCARFRRLECDFASVRNVGRFSQRSSVPAQADQEREPVSYFWQPMVAKVVKRVIAPLIRQPHSLEVWPIVSQMRSLQVLNLENTGIGRLECVGGMWPQLRALTVIEQHLERLELGCLPKLEEFHFCDVGKLIRSASKWPRLWQSRSSKIWRRKERDERYLLRPDRSSKIWRRKERDERYLLPGKDLLLGCPQLKRATVQSSFLKQGQLGCLPAGLVTLELHYFYNATELPDLLSSAHTLQDLDVLECEKLERVNLAINTGFKSLRALKLCLCDNLVEVNGLGCLPSLRVLEVAHCRKLESLRGFENSEMLEELSLRGLAELREISDFSSLGELRVLDLGTCPKLAVAKVREYNIMGRPLTDQCRLIPMALAHYLCGNMGSKLKKCVVSIVVHGAAGECSFDLSNCKELQEFGMYYYGNGEVVYKVEGVDKLEKLSELWITVRNDDEREEVDNDDDIRSAKRINGFSSMVSIGLGSFSFDQLSSMSNLLYSWQGAFFHLWSGQDNLYLQQRWLSLWGWSVLHNLEGIGDGLLSLRVCHLRNLCNLKSLRGVESLIHLYFLIVQSCPVLEEVPSLHALVLMERLIIVRCPKLKAVEGCDYMTKLSIADFDGCESMERLPLSNFNDSLQVVSFAGCRFASDVQKMAAWAMDETAPACLRAGTLRALLVRYYQLDHDAPHIHKEKQEQVAEVLWWSMVRWMPSSNDGCLDFSRLERAWVNEIGTWILRKDNAFNVSYKNQCEDVSFLKAAMQELCRWMQRQSHLHTSSIIHFLNDTHVAKYNCVWLPNVLIPNTYWWAKSYYV